VNEDELCRLMLDWRQLDEIASREALRGIVNAPVIDLPTPGNPLPMFQGTARSGLMSTPISAMTAASARSA